MSDNLALLERVVNQIGSGTIAKLESDDYNYADSGSRMVILARGTEQLKVTRFESVASDQWKLKSSRSFKTDSAAEAAVLEWLSGAVA